MIVITMTDCPTKLRGELSKWLIEVNTGVFVGNVTTKVREQLWDRTCKNIDKGRATMVFSSPGEQKIDFLVHNTAWEPIDFDGIKLIRRPLKEESHLDATIVEKKAQKKESSKSRKNSQAKTYVAVDTETTGLNPETCMLIEVAATRISDGKIGASFSALIRQNDPLPETVVTLTGITDNELQYSGRNEKEVLEGFTAFVGDSTLICHNAKYDSAVIENALSRCGLAPLKNEIEDTFKIAKRMLKGETSLKLNALADYLKLPHTPTHRALQDSLVTAELYLKLKELKND